MESKRVPSRIKSILNYKKPAFWIILVAILAGIVTAVCFLTVPKKDKGETEPEPTAAPVDDPEAVSIPSGEVKEWLDYYSASSELPWEQYREIAIDAFPTVRFRWSSGSVEAVESGSSTRTLFQGMPVWNVYFADVTGDGRPELLSTVSFGSGVIDEHIVVYDYENRQSYTLWGRFKFDYHLYMAEGVLCVGKMPYNGDKQVDYGTLVMHDGVLCCQWHSDGSFTPLNRELHESELYGYWLVEEETDNAGNVLYSKTLDLWKEYNFREDGTVIYNETVPISSNSELAFGHPVSYPYEVHDDFVYIAGDDTSGAFRFGQYDRETRTLTLMYNTDEQTRYAKLRRMGEDITDTPQSLREILLGTYVCTNAERDGQPIPVPDEYAGMKIDLGDSYDLSYPNQASEYFHVASATVGGVEKAGYDWTVDENDMLVVWNPETGDTMRFEWYPKVFGAETLRMLVPDSYNGDYYLIFTFTFDD